MLQGHYSAALFQNLNEENKACFHGWKENLVIKVFLTYRKIDLMAPKSESQRSRRNVLLQVFS